MRQKRGSEMKFCITDRWCSGQNFPHKFSQFNPWILFKSTTNLCMRSFIQLLVHYLSGDGLWGSGELPEWTGFPAEKRTQAVPAADCVITDNCKRQKRYLLTWRSVCKINLSVHKTKNRCENSLKPSHQPVGQHAVVCDWNNQTADPTESLFKTTLSWASIILPLERGIVFKVTTCISAETICICLYTEINKLVVIDALALRLRKQMWFRVTSLQTLHVHLLLNFISLMLSEKVTFFYIAQIYWLQYTISLLKIGL